MACFSTAPTHSPFYISSLCSLPLMSSLASFLRLSLLHSFHSICALEIFSAKQLLVQNCFLSIPPFTAFMYCSNAITSFNHVGCVYYVTKQGLSLFHALRWTIIALAHKRGHFCKLRGLPWAL